MIQYIVLAISPTQIVADLDNLRAEKAISTSFIREFDITPGHEFIPPVYHSRKFHRFFNTLRRLTIGRQRLADQYAHLILREKDATKTIILQIHNHDIRIQLHEFQCNILLRTLQAGGMQEISRAHKQETIYTYPSLKAIYTVYAYSQLRPFLHISSANEISMIKALALIGISLDTVTALTLQNMITQYHLNPLL